MSPAVTVILPLNRWGSQTDAAVRSVLEQSGVDLRLLLVTNGPDRELPRRVRAVCDADPRAQTLRCAVESLPAALNTGLRAAETPLVARMDGDDLSRPGRLARQAAFLEDNPALAGCGCAAEFVDPGGRVVHVVTPPATAAAARWRLLLSNVFVHGSMMLRRDAVLEAGGYDESHGRAQDYDLWLRLAERGLAGVPELLYTYRMPPRELDETQAGKTAAFLQRGWAALPEGDPAAVRPLLARLALGDATARADLEALMEREGPTRAALTAWLWSCWRLPIARTDTPVRERRVAEAAVELRGLGVDRVWLWGAGDLARTIAASGALGVPIEGVVDDVRAGADLAGRVVRDPAELPAGATVVIASDLYEEAIWERSAAARARGVRVLRLPA